MQSRPFRRYCVTMGIVEYGIQEMLILHVGEHWIFRLVMRLVIISLRDCVFSQESCRVLEGPADMQHC